MISRGEFEYPNSDDEENARLENDDWLEKFKASFFGDAELHSPEAADLFGDFSDDSAKDCYNDSDMSEADNEAIASEETRHSVR